MGIFFQVDIFFSFWKNYGNVTKHGDIKLATTEARKKYLLLEPIYHTMKNFSINLLATCMKRTGTVMDKSVYLGLSILETSETVMLMFS